MILLTLASIIFNAPVLTGLLSIVFFASIGISLGVRRAYIKVLLKIFEYGRQNIENNRKLTHPLTIARVDSEDERNQSGTTESFNDSDETSEKTAADVTDHVDFSIGPDQENEQQQQPQQQQHHQSPLRADDNTTKATKATKSTIEKSIDQLPFSLPRPLTATSSETKLSEKHLTHTRSRSYSKPPNGYSNGNNVISRDDALILLPEGGKHHSYDSFSSNSKSPKNVNEKNNNPDSDQPVDFHLVTCLDYIKTGVEAIIEDEVTSRFEAEELKNWNLLTRTNRYYEFISWRLSIIWFIGFFIRYFILMPFRVIICFVGVIWLTICTAVVGCIPDGETKRKMVHNVLIHCFVFLSSALSAVINYHDIQNRPGKTGICVANHTSPIDVLVLMCDNCYSLIGQRHGGFLGVLQRALARASPHIWFERAESKDRMAVAQRLRQHVSDPNNPPILIFPEGTCINNTSVMQFKKGSFEVGGVIYPVAIKYDPRFGDPFWNSTKYSMMQYLFLMMTSWAIVCDVWYLPPMYQEDGESAIVFANRVKSVIAKQGGLVDLSWDGNLKRNKPKDEWKEKQQEEFTKRLKGET